jgi:phosphoglycolate phosphatase
LLGSSRPRQHLNRFAPRHFGKLPCGTILDHLKFATYFDGIHGSVPSGELDHKPELLAHILSKHGLSPSRSLMVGDRRYDISGAHAVGMRGLGVGLVDSPADLARTVLSMVNGKQSPG